MTQNDYQVAKEAFGDLDFKRDTSEMLANFVCDHKLAIIAALDAAISAQRGAVDVERLRKEIRPKLPKTATMKLNYPWRFQ